MKQSLPEKHRPQHLWQVIGQERAVKAVESAIRQTGWGGKAWWISGPSGTGKTTLAKIIASQRADDFFVEECTARNLTVPRVLEIEHMLHLCGGGRGGRAAIINEAHGMRRDVIETWLDVLERLPGHVCVIFTTTKQGEERLFENVDDTGPLLSRCVVLNLVNEGVERAFAEHVQGIARKEYLDGKPIEAYVELAREHDCNMRTMLQEVAKGAMKS